MGLDQRAERSIGNVPVFSAPWPSSRHPRVQVFRSRSTAQAPHIAIRESGVGCKRAIWTGSKSGASLFPAAAENIAHAACLSAHGANVPQWKRIPGRAAHERSRQCGVHWRMTGGRQSRECMTPRLCELQRNHELAEGPQNRPRTFPQLLLLRLVQGLLHIYI
jgi:hypothetical protein